MRFLLLATLLGLALLALAPQAEALERLHSYYELRDDTEALAAQYPDIAIYSEHGSSTGPLGLAIFSVDVALNITALSEAELAALPTMYVDGAHHGNEGMASEAAFLFLQDVLERSTADPAYLDALHMAAANDTLDPAFRALVLSLPALIWGAIVGGGATFGVGYSIGAAITFLRPPTRSNASRTIPRFSSSWCG